MARTAQTAIELQNTLNPDQLGEVIGTKWDEWKTARQVWEAEKRELRDYLFATDTTKTANKTLPWKNSTTQPKLTQLRDNLHANYLSALFPHDDWFKWEAGDTLSADYNKVQAIQAYMRNKLKHSGFYETISRLLYDYIDYGNVFGEVSYATKSIPIGDGVVINQYHGPILHRISPFDIVFDITAPDFKSTPKITRSLASLGSLKIEGERTPWAKMAFESAVTMRANLGQYKSTDINKYAGIDIDGFSDFSTYLSSGMVEILEFEGDIYDDDSQEVLVGTRIIVVDRCHVVHKEPFESWLGTSSKEHVAWRLRPDNLMGMGPLDNLVGMQYRVDHLENLKADVFDQIAHPVLYKRGYVEDFTWGPGAQINGDTESEVRVLSPDTTALNADFQIQNLMNVMEEMAGAPRQAMGIRTPGEKTAFEVQTLDNASSRIFQAKINWFETQFLEPILNQMLEISRRNLEINEVAGIVDEDYGVVAFLDITREDLMAKGRLRPIGSRHFARQNQLAQNLMGFVNSAAYQDPLVNAHISGLALAKALEQLLTIEKFELVQPNIRVTEQMQLQQAQTSAQQIQVDELATAQQIDDEQLGNVE